MIKAIFFDFFNTLAYYEPSREEIYISTCKKHGIEVDAKTLSKSLIIADTFWREEDRRYPIDTRTKEEKTAFYIDYVKLALEGAGVEASRELAGEILLKMRQINWEFKCFNDSISTLRMLKERGLTLGMISNAAKDMEETYRSLGLQDNIDFVITSFEVGSEKPNPEIFLAALQKAGMRPDEVIFVGDQYDLDILGARGVGMKAIMIDRNDWFPDITDCPRILGLSEITEHI